MKIKLRTVFLLCFSVLMSTAAFSQQQAKQKPLKAVGYSENVNAPLTANELAQMEAAYGTDYMNSYILKHSHIVNNLKNILRNRVKVVDAGDKDLSSMPKLSEVEMFNEHLSNPGAIGFDPQSFNPLLYSFEFYTRDTFNKIYWVDYTSYYIIIKPQYQL